METNNKINIWTYYLGVYLFLVFIILISIVKAKANVKSEAIEYANRKILHYDTAAEVLSGFYLRDSSHIN